MLSLGIHPLLGLRVPRTENPYHVARCIRRLARIENDDTALIKRLVAANQRREPRPSPELDLPNPIERPDAA